MNFCLGSLIPKSCWVNRGRPAATPKPSRSSLQSTTYVTSENELIMWSLSHSDISCIVISSPHSVGVADDVLAHKTTMEAVNKAGSDPHWFQCWRGGARSAEQAGEPQPALEDYPGEDWAEKTTSGQCPAAGQEPTPAWQPSGISEAERFLKWRYEWWCSQHEAKNVLS